MLAHAARAEAGVENLLTFGNKEEQFPSAFNTSISNFQLINRQGHQ